MNTVSQQQIKDLVRNQTNNHGTFYISEKLTFEGQEIDAFLVLPASLALKADEITKLLFEEFDPLEIEEPEETTPEAPKTEKKVAPKKVTKKKK